MKKCSDVMTKNPSFAVTQDTAKAVAQLMKSEDIGPVPVVDDPSSWKLVGILTDRDLALKVVAEGRDPKTTRVEAVMTHNPITCREGDDLDKALHAMAEHQVRHIPVVNHNHQIVGIISQADVATRQDNAQKTAEVVEEISKPGLGSQ